MIRIFVKKLSLSGFTLIALLAGPFWGLANASPFQNLQVGTANGPEGRTNIQTLFNGENGVLFSGKGEYHAQKSPDGFYFSDDQGPQAGKYDLSIDNCGPGTSTKCLRIDQLTGSYQDHSAWKFAQFYWSGPRSGITGFVQEAKRANSHGIWVKGFDELLGDNRQNLVFGTYHKRRTPTILDMSNPESDNMHFYWATKENWGGTPGVWREIVWRENPTTQRSDAVLPGYDGALEHASLNRDLTRFYYQFDCGSDQCGPNTIYMDNLIFFYENPFIAMYPQTFTIHAKPGQTVQHQVIVWNTHPTETRSFSIKIGGWKTASGTDWLVKNPGTTVSTDQTGPLAPGQGFVFTIYFTVPSQDKYGMDQQDGNRGVLQFGVFRNPDEVSNPRPEQEANPLKKTIQTIAMIYLERGEHSKF